MINAFYSAKSGTKNYQNYLDAVANNLSNVNSESYKAQSVSFTDLMYTAFSGNNGELQSGSGSRILVSRDMSAGNVTTSSDSMDIFIDGDGFLAVKDVDGKIAYTRSGSLSAIELEGVNYLVTAQGDFVLDANLDKIKIPDVQSVSFSAPAEAAFGNENTITLGIFTFSNPEQLVETSGGNYTIAEGSALTAQPDTKSTVEQNMIESSNVDAASELVKMIVAQRGFQMNVKMIQTADEMEQYANKLTQ